MSAKEFIDSYCRAQGWSTNIEAIQDESLTDQSYFIENSIERIIRYKELQGLRNGINALNRNLFVKPGAHKPSFSTRGVIEGFYGKPWSHEQRLRGLTFFAAHNMNLFILAPKDDPWQRFDWRTPFGADFLAHTNELIKRGKSLLVDIAICVSPGLTVRYSDGSDVEALMVRYRQLAAIGVRTFGLLLDDIAWELQFEEDQKKYSSIAEAHSEFSNRIYQALKAEIPGASLITCPLQYHGRGHERYIKEFGNSLDSEIHLMWTGRQICSEYLESVDAIYFKEQTSKSPFYWDNFPVNDVAMIHQLHVGPIEKRDRDLGSHSAGLVANPMEKFELSLISLATIGDYLWDSENYNPEESWNRALEFLLPDLHERTAWMSFLSNCFESCLAVDPAPDFGRMLGRATLLWRTGKKDRAVADLQAYAKQMKVNASVVRSSSKEEWIKESQRWLNKYEKVADALSDIAQILERSKVAPQGNLIGSARDADVVRQIRNSLGADQTRIFGDGLDLTLGELATELSGAR